MLAIAETDAKAASTAMASLLVQCVGPQNLGWVGCFSGLYHAAQTIVVWSGELGRASDAGHAK